MAFYIIYSPADDGLLPEISKEDWFASTAMVHIAGSKTLANELATKWAQVNCRKVYIFTAVSVAVPPKPQPATLEDIVND